MEDCHQAMRILGFRFNHPFRGLQTRPEKTCVFAESGMAQKRRSECLSARPIKGTISDTALPCSFATAGLYTAARYQIADSCCGGGVLSAHSGCRFPAEVILTSAHTRYGELASVCPTARTKNSRELGSVELTAAAVWRDEAPHGTGTAGPQGRSRDDDLHPRLERRRRSQSGRRIVR